MALPAAFDPLVNAPRSRKFGVGLVLLAALGAAAYFLLLAPVLTRVDALRVQEASLRRELAQARAIAAEIGRFRREAAELEKRLAVLTERLPNEKEMPALYRTVSDNAFQSGLSVSLFQPKDPKAHDYYSEIPIVVTAETGYHQLGEFFTRVGTLTRVVTVENMKLTGLSRAKNALRAELVLATYTYRPVGSPPPPKAPGKKP